MKKFLKFGCLGTIGLVILLGILVAVTPSPESTATTTETTPEPTPTPAPARAWYQDGTLHQSTLDEWQAASDENKLATAADWVVTVYEPAPTTPEATRPLAEAVVTCIDTLLADDAAGLDKAGETAPAALMCITVIQAELEGN